MSRHAVVDRHAAEPRRRRRACTAGGTAGLVAAVLRRDPEPAGADGQRARSEGRVDLAENTPRSGRSTWTTPVLRLVGDPDRPAVADDRASAAAELRTLACRFSVSAGRIAPGGCGCSRSSRRSGPRDASSSGTVAHVSNVSTTVAPARREVPAAAPASRSATPRPTAVDAPAAPDRRSAAAPRRRPSPPRRPARRAAPAALALRLAGAQRPPRDHRHGGRVVAAGGRQRVAAELARGRRTGRPAPSPAPGRRSCRRPAARPPWLDGRGGGSWRCAQSFASSPSRTNGGCAREHEVQRRRRARRRRSWHRPSRRGSAPARRSRACRPSGRRWSARVVASAALARPKSLR